MMIISSFKPNTELILFAFLSKKTSKLFFPAKLKLKFIIYIWLNNNLPGSNVLDFVF